MDKFAIAIGVLAGIVQLAGYWKYNQLMSQKVINPNATSWALWGMGGAIEYLIYGDLARDWVKEFLPLMCAVAVFGTFVHVLWKGTLQRPDKSDIQLFCVDALVVGLWIYTKDPLTANILLALDITLSHVPILYGTWKDPGTENGTPWIIWTLAYALLTFTVVLRWEQWGDLIYPLCYLVLCGMMWALVRFPQRRTAAV